MKILSEQGRISSCYLHDDQERKNYFQENHLADDRGT
jgi:hypothetical protein